MVHRENTARKARAEIDETLKPDPTMLALNNNWIVEPGLFNVTVTEPSSLEVLKQSAQFTIKEKIGAVAPILGLGGGEISRTKKVPAPRSHPVA